MTTYDIRVLFAFPGTDEGSYRGRGEGRIRNFPIFKLRCSIIFLIKFSNFVSIVKNYISEDQYSYFNSQNLVQNNLFFNAFEVLLSKHHLQTYIKSCISNIIRFFKFITS